MLCSSHKLLEEHKEVMRFASGMREELGTFISEYLLPGQGSLENVFLAILRENKLFSEDLFKKIHLGERFRLNAPEVQLTKAEMQSLWFVPSPG